MDKKNITRYEIPNREFLDKLGLEGVKIKTVYSLFSRVIVETEEL